MSMKKNLLIAAIAITALASCSSNDFVGDESPQGSIGTNGAISFGFDVPAITRSGGATAATSLNNNFVVFGYKTVSSSPQVVFDNYQVNYVTSSDNTTTSNSAGWEYVGYKNLPSGVRNNAGVINFAASTTGEPNNSTAIDQSIKYWDYNASQYDFFAYSLGTGSSSTWAKASAMTNSTYTLEGTIAQLGTCYISKKKHIDAPSSNTPQVQLEFVNFLSKIQLKFFETIPGYSVKDLRFYYDASHKTQGTTAGDGLKPAIYGANEFTSNGGTYTISFDENNEPVVTLNSSSLKASKVEFDAISDGVWLNDYAARDYKETEETVYLGRAANAATATNQISVIPNSTGAVLTLKMDYTLVSRDGTGETILVEGATATIPAQFTAWKPNFAYTYIFKITDDKLIPITLDAVVTDAQNGSQETITTVSEPSITTFGYNTSTNKYITDSNEYPASVDVYATVMDASALATLSATNFSIYDVTTSDATNFPVTEASVAEALIEGPTWTKAQADNKKITCVGGPTLTFQNTVPAEDGTTITLDASDNKAAKFTTATGKKYALVYQKTAASYIVDNGNTYADETAFNNAGTLYTSAACTDVATSFDALTTYFKRTAVVSKGVYAVKIVTVP